MLWVHSNGAKVVVSGQDRATLEDVSRQLGYNVVAVQADVSKLGDIDRLKAHALEPFGKLDILFVNAGVFKGTPLEEIDVAALREAKAQFTRSPVRSRLNSLDAEFASTLSLLALQ